MEGVSDPDRLYRRDGSLISGLTRSEWDYYVEKYSTVPLSELLDIRDTINEPAFCEFTFTYEVDDLLWRKANENRNGIDALFATPVFMLLFVHVKLKPVLKRKQFSVYGEITSRRGFINERDYIYEREFPDVENFGPDGGNLTLNGPSLSCLSNDVGYILGSSKLLIKLYDDSRGILANGCIELSHSENEFEEVKDLKVYVGECLLTLKYVSIPMAIYGRLELLIFNKCFLGEHAKLPESVKVYGKVFATYKNTFGNYNSEEIVLFEKNANEFKEVVIARRKNNLFSGRRCWVAVPAYSLLCVHIDLLESTTNKQILKKDVELETNFCYGASKNFIDGEFFIKLRATWFDPCSLRDSQDGDDSGQGEHEDGDDSGQGDRDVYMDDDSGQGEREDGGGDGVQTAGILESCSPVQQFPAFEVFSVLICNKECTPLKIYGLLQLSFDLRKDFYDRRTDIFRKDKEDPLSLSGRGNTIPVLDGSRHYDSSYPLSVICDLKDTLDKLKIKGFQSSLTDNILLRDTQLCSVFQGDHGFAALHYAIFRSAVQAKLKVFYTENGLKRGDVPVFGSFCAQYNDFDYSSEYDKKCYKIVFFERVREEDSVQVKSNGLIPLSRSSFVGPSDSSFLFDVDLRIGTQRFFVKVDIEIGRPSKTIRVGKCKVEIDLEWSGE